MPILKAVCVRDNAVEAYMPPTFIPHLGSALREFQKCVADPKHHFSESPKDFDLYHLGDWDDSTGRLTPNDPPVRLLRGVDIALTDN